MTGRTTTYYVDEATLSVIAKHQAATNAANASVAMRDLVLAGSKSDAAEQIAWLRSQVAQLHDQLENAYAKTAELARDLAKARKDAARARALTDPSPEADPLPKARTPKQQADLERMVRVARDNWSMQGYGSVAREGARAEAQGRPGPPRAPPTLVHELRAKVGSWRGVVDLCEKTEA